MTMLPTSLIVSALSSLGVIVERIEISESLPVNTMSVALTSILIPENAGSGEKTEMALETIESLS